MEIRLYQWTGDPNEIPDKRILGSWNPANGCKKIVTYQILQIAELVLLGLHVPTQLRKVEEYLS